MNKIRWGILGTGFVATKFSLGLKMLADHEITAVASRSPKKAEQFIKGIGSTAKALSYEELAIDNDVDVIYVATPPSLHKEHALLCIEHKKPVLIEKPFATNATDARSIAEAAIANQVFCMEAMWTRFTPLIRHIKQQADSGELGTIHSMTGSFCTAEQASEQNNLFSPSLGGGSLLDRAVYPISLATHLMGAPSHVSGHLLEGENNIDVHSSVSLQWKNQCTAQFTASLITNGLNDFTISGSNSFIHIQPPIYRPFKMQISAVKAAAKSHAKPPSAKDVIKENHWLHQIYQRLGGLLPSTGKNLCIPYAGNAYHYQAQEVFECLKSGKIQSDIMPLSDSVTVLDIVDKLRNNPNET